MESIAIAKPGLVLFLASLRRYARAARALMMSWSSVVSGLRAGCGGQKVRVTLMNPCFALTVVIRGTVTYDWLSSLGSWSGAALVILITRENKQEVQNFLVVVVNEWVHGSLIYFSVMPICILMYYMTHVHHKNNEQQFVFSWHKKYYRHGCSYHLYNNLPAKLGALKSRPALFCLISAATRF